MRSRRLVWQLFPSLLGITLMALLAMSWYFSRELREFYYAQAAIDLTARARLVAQQVAADFDASAAQLDALSKRLGEAAAARLTLIRASGEVVGDSRENPARMENHADRPEVLTALSGTAGIAVRFSQTLQKDMLYVAAPVPGAAGVVRAALPLTAIDAPLRRMQGRLAVAGLVVALATALLSLALGRRLSRPLEEMRRGAERFAEGHLEQHLSVGGSEEVGALAEAMNRMAGQLDERLRVVLRQRNEQEAVLTSMVEGVLAVDSDERILRLNRAAGHLLGLAPQEVQGRPLQEVLRKADLQRFIARALASGEPVEGDIVLPEPGGRFLQAHGTPLRGAQGQEIGALVVLNDITRLRRLENVRRDFVANVSHELKTPITAIKGSAETLLDGAMDEPDAARRFVEIIAKQSDRLNAIINDLLVLSRIEQEGEGLPLEVGPLFPVLEAARQACQHSARAKELRIDLDAPRDLRARMNSPLLEQALVNLLANAINYSEFAGHIVLAGLRDGDRVKIRVRDRGCGIEKKHLPRLFERFYRVDKARSRKLGGTGLGLAIVKHIVQAHGGTVTVESTPGQGSVFTIDLPSAGSVIRDP
ncbi:MAG: ATP-binding protein [Desulfuromonadales bacterium]